MLRARQLHCLKVPPRLRKVPKKRLLPRQERLSMPGSMHNISVLWPRSVVAPTRSSNGAAKSACDRTSCCSLLNWEIAHGDGHRALAGDGAEAASIRVGCRQRVVSL